MEMDEEFLENNDLDWFASCQDGLLAHFATGGRGFVPMTVRESISVYESVYDYFFSIEDSVAVEVIYENLPVFSDDIQRERYLKSFVDMARRGVLSYDVGGGRGYNLIARPRESRVVDSLPLVVKRNIPILPLSFSLKIDVNDLL